MFYSLQWYSNRCNPQYELTVLLPQTSLILKVLPAIFGSLFWCLPKLFHLDDPASRVVTVCKSIFCFSCWKLLNYWNLAARDWERASCHANRISIGFGVACRSISLHVPSCMGLCCKLAEKLLFTNFRLDRILGLVYDIIRSAFHTF